MPTRRARKPSKTAAASASLIEHLNECVSDALAALSGIGRRKMLVSFGWSVNERVFALVSRQGRIVVRIPDEQTRGELSALEGAAPWKFGSKAPPRDWLLLPEWMHDDAAQLEAWLTRAWKLNQSAKPRVAKRAPTKPKVAKPRRKAASRKTSLRRTPPKTK